MPGHQVMWANLPPAAVANASPPATAGPIGLQPSGFLPPLPVSPAVVLTHQQLLHQVRSSFFPLHLSLLYGSPLWLFLGGGIRASVYTPPVCSFLNECQVLIYFPLYRPLVL
jgi:hypothetical protein